MPEMIQITINGKEYRVPQGTTVAAALVLANIPSRVSESGGYRAPLCGMGICFECRTTINGERHQRSCQILCENSMDVQTQ